MKIEWKQSESTVRPKEVDYESSPTTVYLHRNIREEERPNDPDGDGEMVTWYVYEEATLTPAEYTVYAADQTREDNIAIMEALVDIYDMLGQ